MRPASGRAGRSGVLGPQPAPQAHVIPPPNSEDWFYPDFLSRRTDGRILAVEYKGKSGVEPEIGLAAPH